MPFSARQLRSIVDGGERPIIAPGDVNHYGLRVTESYVRRQLYKGEDRTAAALRNLYRGTWRQMRQSADRIADQQGITRLKMDTASIRWSQETMEALRGQTRALESQVVRLALRQSVGAWWMAYLGKGWQVAQISGQQPVMRLAVDATARALGIHEAYTVDYALLKTLVGAHWQTQFGAHYAEMLAKMQTSLNTSLAMGLDYRIAIRNLAGVMGISIDAGARGNYNRIEAITRTVYMDAANRGAVDLYRGNPEIVIGLQFLSANDGRVCRKCAALNGTVWGVNDMRAVIPPRDTHSRCRCTIIPVVGGEMMVLLNEPPKETLMEWLNILGIAWMINDFMNPGESDGGSYDDLYFN